MPSPNNGASNNKKELGDVKQCQRFVQLLRNGRPQRYHHRTDAVAGIVAARTATAAKGYLIGGGIIYLVLWIYGLIIDPMSGANFVPLNTADNWQHLGLGLGMTALGLILAGRRRRSETSASNR